MKAIVVSFDHLPVGFLGLHGNTWVDTPAFDRLASEGVVFESHYAADITDIGRDWWPDGGANFGVRSAAFVERGTGSPSGFDEVVEVAGEDGLDVPLAETPFAKTVLAASEWLANAQDDDWLLWLRSRGVPRPWLPPRELAEKYVELFEDLEEDVLDPADYEGDVEWELVEFASEDDDDEGEDEFAEDEEWDGGSEDAVETLPGEEEFDLDEAEEFDELLVALASVGLREDTSGIEVADWLLVRAVYGGYVSLLDRGLGELLRAVAETVGEDVLVVVTGGAGESLGERAELPAECDALGLGEEVVHTPLLVRGPGVLPGVRRRELVTTADLPATLRDWFWGETERTSWRPIALGEPESNPTPAVGVRGEGVDGLRTEDWYLVADASRERVRLFAKPDDVWDLHDVSGQEPGTVDELLERLGDVDSGNPSNSR